jgi:hypothetical protein
MGKAVGSILGGKAPKTGSVKGGDFQPFTYKTSLGTATGTRDGQSFNVGIGLSPELQALQAQSLAATSGLFPSYLQQIQQRPEQFQFGYDPRAAQQQMFQEQAALLQPAFAQQRQQLQSSLFGTGRMGLMLAGETAGAGAGGMVQPDAFGLGRAQSQTLADLASATRTQAMQEQGQLFGEALQGYEARDTARQQYLQNLAGGFSGMFGTATGIGEIERAIAGQATGFEEARARAKSGAAVQQAPSTGLAETGLMAAATYWGMQSDIRLKENIVPLGKVNGHKMYSWDWNDTAKALGIDNPTVGVLAQEVMEYMPEAVRMDSDGYYRVDYKMLEESL